MNELWIAQFDSDNGGDEMIVMFDEKPSSQELDDYCRPRQTLRGLFEFTQTSGPRLSGLPTERELATD